MCSWGGPRATTNEETNNEQLDTQSSRSSFTMVEVDSGSQSPISLMALRLASDNADSPQRSPLSGLSSSISDISRTACSPGESVISSLTLKSHLGCHQELFYQPTASFLPDFDLVKDVRSESIINFYPDLPKIQPRPSAMQRVSSHPSSLCRAKSFDGLSRSGLYSGRVNGFVDLNRSRSFQGSRLDAFKD